MGEKTSLTPTPQVLPTPTVKPTLTQPCTSHNDCPKQMCIPADKPCIQYYCIEGKCQLVEPVVDLQEERALSLNEKIKLTPGQTVNIKNTSLSLTLLSITTPPKNCFDCPTTAELEMREGNQKEEIAFITGVLARASP